MNKLVLGLVSVIVAVGASAAQWENTGGTITMKTPAAGAVTLKDRQGAGVDGAAVGQPGVTPAKAWAKGQGAAGDVGGFWGALFWLPDASKPDDWKLAMGEKVSGGSLEPVIESLVAKTGRLNGTDWKIQGGAMNTAYSFKIAAFYGLEGTQAAVEAQLNLPAELRVLDFSAPIRVTLGGYDQDPTVPPHTAGSVGGTASWAVAVPEPSVLALGMLGLGAFLLRRRS